MSARMSPKLPGSAAGNGGPSRRRVLTILAGVAGTTGVLALGGKAGWGRAAGPLLEWRGAALGAEGRIVIAGRSRTEARALIARVRAEIARLEAIFSLYRPNSEVSRLNRDGLLRAPAPELVELLSLSRRISDLSAGAFDITVQPLWRLYAEHFARAGADPAGPPAASIRRVRALVDFTQVQVSPEAIRLARPGMAITMNGIAQGYIADRIADLLRREGLARVLVSLGEIRALGGHPAGHGWRLSIPDPLEPARQLEMLEVADQAVATSAGAATRFDGAGRFHHLFDPVTGVSAGGYRSVTVVAERAAIADGLSTALYVMPQRRAAELLAGFARARAILFDAGGHRRALPA